MCSTSTHCVLMFVCLCVCVYVACLPVPYVLAHPKHRTDTCCTCMTIDSSQTGLTKTAPRSPGCSDWKPQDTSVAMRKIAPAFLSEVGHCPLTIIKGGEGAYPPIDTPMYLSSMCLSAHL